MLGDLPRDFPQRINQDSDGARSFDRHFPMLIREKITVENSDWLTRTVFTNSEERLSSALIPIIALGSALEGETNLDRIVEIISSRQSTMMNRLSLLDMSDPNPAKGRFIVKGSYRFCDLERIETIDEVKQPLMLKNLLSDSFAARGLGFSICSKNRGMIDGVYYNYDRVMVPIQSPDTNLMITAYWSDV